MSTETKKSVLRGVRLPETLDRQLSDFHRRTGIPQSHIIREGIALAMSLSKYQPLLAATESSAT